MTPEEALPLPAPDGVGTRFPCRGCGATMAWDPDLDALACGFCGVRVPVPRGEETIVERALSEAGSAARGLGVERRVARCRTCGAQTSYDQRETAVVCVFCGSPQVLEQASNRNALRPESLIPLDVGRAAVEREFKAWLGRLWFRPSALRSLRTLDATGVYVPCWTFDCAVHSDWTAQSGTYYYVPQTYTAIVNGKPVVRTRMVQKVRWRPAAGAREDAYDDLLIHASRGVPEALARNLGDFDLKALVPYRPEYLAGWRAEEYAIDLEEGWKLAEQRVTETQRSRCSADVPGDTQADLRVRNVVRDVRWKHVLLPYWSATYRWRGKTYPVVIHGQSGRVSGEAPYSGAKIAALVAVLLLAAVVLFLLLSIAGALDG